VGGRVKTYRASRSRSARAQAKVKSHVSQGQSVRAFLPLAGGARARSPRCVGGALSGVYEQDASGVRGREQGLTPRKVSDRVAWGYVGLGRVT